MVALRSPVKSPVKIGFTLIEMSIVLVIIGLIIGGVLVGRDLISAASVRAQISQIEKYQSAVNTFRGKYGYLPGDIPDPAATQYGFIARGQYEGEGDGNGLIQGTDGTYAYGQFERGELLLFWEDLSMSNLIGEAFTITGAATVVGCPTQSCLSGYFPRAKVGSNNFIFVSNGGYCGNGSCANGPSPPWNSNGKNYFTIETASQMSGGGPGQVSGYGNISVSIAFAIDKKMDDGQPTSGKITSQTLNNGCLAFGEWPTWQCSPFTTATSPSASTCFDNGGIAGATQQYSMIQNGGSGTNCSLTFQFQ